MFAWAKTQKPQILYAVPQDDQPRKLGETPVFRNPKSDGIDLSVYTNKFKTLHDVYRNRFVNDPESRCFGRREMTPEGKLSTAIQWYSNGWVLGEAEAFGSGLLNLGLCPPITEWHDMTLKFVGIFAKNSLEYMLADIGCSLYGITSVPIYDTLGEEATLFAFNQTHMTSCIVSANHVEKILQHKQDKGYFEDLKTLIVIDWENLAANLESKYKADIKLISFRDVKTAGRANISKWADVKPSDIYTFSYTSGTTGEPKGAMLTHSNMTSIIVAALDILCLKKTDSYIDYLPLAHVMERIGINVMHAENIPIFIFSGDVQKLKEDLAISKPTIFFSVPRLYNRFYDVIQKGIQEKKGMLRKLIDHATKVKIENLRTQAKYTHSIYDRIVFKKMRAALGGNVRAMITGSAPMTQEVQEFMKICFSSPMFEAYGQTEGTGLEFATVAEDPLSGHVGGPSVVCEFKLVDVPEMRYTSEDKDEEGNPQPRGEIWVRGPLVIPGYYKADEKNKETFTPDGWLMSGDIGMLVGKERRLKIVDRKKNIFKLAQGEYIAPEKLENIYKLAHTEVAGIFVYGDSLKSYLIAVINIEKSGLKKLASDLGVPEDTPENLAKSPLLKQKVIELLNKTAVQNKLNPLERIKFLHIETQLFADLDLLTAAFKLKRFEAKDHYKAVLDEMYSQAD